MTAERIPGGIPAGAVGADLEFYRAGDRYLDDLFRSHPTSATAAGYHRHDGILDDWSAVAVRARIDLARGHQRVMAAIAREPLSPGARIDLDLVTTDIESSLFTITDLRPHERDPQFYVDLLGNAVLYLTLQEPGAAAWPERLTALLGRMRSVPDFLATARASIREPPRVTTEMVLQTNAGNLRFFEEALPNVFDQAPAMAPALRAEAARAAASLREFQVWLERDLLPRASGDWRLGPDLWGRKLSLTLQSDMPAGTIISRAQESIRTQRLAMQEVAGPLHARLFHGHTHREQGEALLNIIVGEVIVEVSLRHPTRATLFDHVRKSIDRIKRFIRETDLVPLPPDDDPFVIEPTPGFLDGMAVAFFNPPPTLEPDLKKSFWISSVPGGGMAPEPAAEESFLREYNDYALQGLAIHEAFPGHYVQYWHALRSPLATVYKNIFSSGTFAEGWAVLAENLMFDAGYAKDEPENLLVHLKHSLRAPINALLDARLHTDPEPEEEADRWALDLLVRTGFQEEAEARGKMRRAKVTSTQLSTYFVGLIEMQDLLNDARRAAGSAFRMSDFTTRVLSFGTIPPRDVRTLMGLSRQNVSR